MDRRVCLALVVVALCCAFLGGCSYQAASLVSNSEQAEEKDPILISCSCNDPAGTIDPGEDKDVGCCICEIVDPTNATVTIDNAYPGYQCRITFKLKNTDTEAVTITIVNITTPSAIKVSADPSLMGKVIQPTEEIQGFIDMRVNDSAMENANYTCTVEIDGE